MSITQIRVGKKPYKNAGDFVQYFLAKRYNLKYYQEKYKKLKNSLEPLITKLIDNENELRNLDGKILIKKRNPNFYILLCDGNIEIKQSFLDKIKNKILNNENFRLFHAGVKLSSTPFRIKGLEIYNELNYKLTKKICDYYNNLEIKDTFDIILLYLIFYLLKEENKNTPFSYLFEKFAGSLITKICFSNNFVNIEDNIIEFKSRDFVSGNNQKIVKRLEGDIKKKLRESCFKIYMLGANEDTKEFEPLSLNKFDDNRISQIKSLLQKTGIHNTYFLKVPSKDAKNCILILIVMEDKTMKSQSQT